jgi:hypothetical protein
MAKLISTLMVLITLGSDCIAQHANPRQNAITELRGPGWDGNKMRYGLIDGSSRTNQSAGDYISLQYGNDFGGYERYAGYVAAAYRGLLNLDNARELALRFEIIKLYQVADIPLMTVHNAIGKKLKEMLGFKPYLDWTKWTSYPESSYFVGAPPPKQLRLDNQVKTKKAAH